MFVEQVFGVQVFDGVFVSHGVDIGLVCWYAVDRDAIGVPHD